MGKQIIAEDYVGLKYEKLTIIGLGESKVYFDKKRNLNCKSKTFICECECGNTKEINVSNFKAGKTKSCGCYKESNAKNSKRTHGYTSVVDYGKRKSEYSIWATMLQRCNNKNTEKYKFYGAKGTKVSPEWHLFENFIRDMGERPDASYSLDRINTKGDYEKGNCRWATKIVQANNTIRNNHLILNGVKLNVKEWSQKTGINASTIKNRLKTGWSIEQALTIPARKTNLEYLHAKSK